VRLEECAADIAQPTNHSAARASSGGGMSTPSPRATPAWSGIRTGKHRLFSTNC